MTLGRTGRFASHVREADWLGRQRPRDKLAMVSPRFASVKVLRLNPLTDEDIAQILEAASRRWPMLIGIYFGGVRERCVDALLSQSTDPEYAG